MTESRRCSARYQSTIENTNRSDNGKLNNAYDYVSVYTVSTS